MTDQCHLCDDHKCINALLKACEHKLAIATEALKALNCRRMPMDCPHMAPEDIKSWCARCAALCLLEIQP